MSSAPVASTPVFAQLIRSFWICKAGPARAASHDSLLIFGPCPEVRPLCSLRSIPYHRHSLSALSRFHPSPFARLRQSTPLRSKKETMNIGWDMPLHYLGRQYAGREAAFRLPFGTSNALGAARSSITADAGTSEYTCGGLPVPSPSSSGML